MARPLPLCSLWIGFNWLTGSVNIVSGANGYLVDVVDVASTGVTGRTYGSTEASWSLLVLQRLIHLSLLVGVRASYRITDASPLS